MSLNKRLINTGGGAGAAYNIENLTLTGQYTITEESRSWYFEYMQNDRVLAVATVGYGYGYYITPPSSLNPQTTDIRRKNIEFKPYAFANQIKFVSTPSAGRIYLAIEDGGTKKIAEYNVNSDGTWFITAAAQQVFAVSSLSMPSNQESKGHDFNSDGTKLYVSTSSNYYTFSLSTAYNLNTATLLTTGTNSIVLNKVFRFNPDGTRLFVGNYTPTPRLEQYELSTPYDISTGTLSFVKSNPVYAAYGNFSFNEDGTKLYARSSSSGTINEYTL